MSILNQPISPTGGQPTINSKDYATEGARQHAQLAAPPLHGANCSTNPSGFESAKKKTSVSATSSSSSKGIFKLQAQLPFPGASNIVTSTECQVDMIVKQADRILNLSHLFGNEYRASPTDVLVVAVSSAVELDSRQIDLITRKMQRLTGFRKLRLENNVDPSLIAGFVISYCDDESQVIDLSVKGQLAMLTARLESSERVQNIAAHFGDT